MSNQGYQDALDTMRARFREFEDKFIALKADYPEFFMSFVNHADYIEALESVQSDLHDALDCDGDEDVEDFEFQAPSDMTEFCTFMSKYIDESFDASCGVSWESLKDAAADYMGEVTR